MFIETVPNRASPPAVLLRESFRDDQGRSQKRTLANLSKLPGGVIEGLKAPVTSAMMAIYATKLHWRPDTVYRLSNDAVFAQWDWGHGMGRVESISAMQSALSLDPDLHILIAHGLSDLRTPYFATVRILRALPEVDPPGRVHLAVYPGGHMFYLQDASRRALHDDAETLFRK